MCKCIYCNKTEAEVSFVGEEHILPKTLGGENFDAIPKEYICSDCNSRVFSNLETNFKQDSYEGVLSQMYELNKNKSVWIRGECIDIKQISGLGSEFETKPFIYLRFNKNNPEAYFKSQLKVRNKKSGFQVFPLKTLEELAQSESKQFEKHKERLSKVSQKDMALFVNTETDGENAIESAIELLKKYNIKYVEKKRFPLNDGRKVSNLADTEIELEWTSTMDKEILRVLCKIAFNYFAYSAIREGKRFSKLPYNENFNSIKDFILNGTGDLNDFVKIIDKGSVVEDEKKDKIRFIAHSIKMYLKENNIYVEVSLFGSSIYEIFIGKYPYENKQENFGSGHMFDPFSKRTIRMSTKQPDNTSTANNDRFGIFNID